jgi:carbonic anhydrase
MTSPTPDGVLRPRFDLGLRALASTWVGLLRPAGLRGDVIAALTVAAIAVPLSLAIALASEVPPAVGVVSAIIAALVVPWFGGTPLAVTGPAAVLAVLVGTIVEEHGLTGVLFATVLAGALQILGGVLGLGRYLLLVPLSVVHGFSAGIGAILVLQQLPRILGFPAPDESHIWAVVSHLGDRIGDTNPWELGFALISMAVTMLTGGRFPRTPGVLLGVAALTIAAHLGSLPVQLLGSMPSGLPTPTFPGLPSTSILPLVGDALVLFAVASLGTLLTSAAVDRLSRRAAHDPDQELIGQGLGNMACAAFGGLPVTGAISRSSLNVLAGAHTRRAALFQGLVLLLVLQLGSSLLAAIPVATLAGILLALALRMLDPRVPVELTRTSTLDGVIYGVTLLTMVVVDLVAGVQAGLTLALLLAALRLGQPGTRIDIPVAGPVRVVFRGPLTFVATVALADVAAHLRTTSLRPGLLLDLRAVQEVDASGVDAVHGMVALARRYRAAVALLGARADVRDALIAGDPVGDIEACFAASAADAATLLRSDGGALRLTLDVGHRGDELAKDRPDLLQQLSAAQRPHSLLFTCADSRVVPELITGADPGEIFVMRNIGAIVPRPGQEALLAEQAGLWYAIEVLGITDVIVCGHSNCGAARALWGHDRPPDSGPLVRWLASVRGNVGPLHDIAEHDDVARRIVQRQLENLRSHPFVAEREAQGRLTLHAWFYDVGRAEVLEWNEARGEFISVRGRPAS